MRSLVLFLRFYIGLVLIIPLGAVAADGSSYEPTAVYHSLRDAIRVFRGSSARFDGAVATKNPRQQHRFYDQVVNQGKTMAKLYFDWIHETWGKSFLTHWRALTLEKSQLRSQIVYTTGELERLKIARDGALAELTASGAPPGMLSEAAVILLELQREIAELARNSSIEFYRYDPVLGLYAAFRRRYPARDKAAFFAAQTQSASYLERMKNASASGRLPLRDWSNILQVRPSARASSTEALADTALVYTLTEVYEDPISGARLLRTAVLPMSSDDQRPLAARTHLFWLPAGEVRAFEIDTNRGELHGGVYTASSRTVGDDPQGAQIRVMMNGTHATLLWSLPSSEGHPRAQGGLSAAHIGPSESGSLGVARSATPEALYESRGSKSGYDLVMLQGWRDTERVKSLKSTLDSGALSLVPLPRLHDIDAIFEFPGPGGEYLLLETPRRREAESGRSRVVLMGTPGTMRPIEVVRADVGQDGHRTWELVTGAVIEVGGSVSGGGEAQFFSGKGKSAVALKTVQVPTAGGAQNFAQRSPRIGSVQFAVETLGIDPRRYRPVGFASPFPGGGACDASLKSPRSLGGS